MVDDMKDVTENSGKIIFVDVRHFSGKYVIGMETMVEILCCCCLGVALSIPYLEAEYKNVGMCDVTCLFMNYVCL